MAKVRDITVKLVLDPSGAITGIKTADGAVAGFESHVEDAGKKVTLFGGTMNKVFAIGVTAAAAAATAAMVRFGRDGIRFLSDSVRLAGIQDIAEKKLEQALANLGEEALAQAPSLKQLASDLQRVSNFGDESIITAQAMLLSFREAAGPEGVKKLSQPLLDLAAGMAKTSGETIDLNTAASTLGRALTQGAGALTRYGISLTDVQKAQFDTATEMEKVNLLVEILGDNFGGLAAAMVDPARQAENAWGDLKEKLGRELLPTWRELQQEFIYFAQSDDVAELARQLGAHIAEGLQKISRWVQTNQGLILSFFEDAGTSVGLFAEGLVRVYRGMLFIRAGMTANAQYWADWLNSGSSAALSLEDAMKQLSDTQDEFWNKPKPTPAGGGTGGGTGLTDDDIAKLERQKTITQAIWEDVIRSAEAMRLESVHLGQDLMNQDDLELGIHQFDLLEDEILEVGEAFDIAGDRLKESFGTAALSMVSAFGEGIGTALMSNVPIIEAVSDAMRGAVADILDSIAAQWAGIAVASVLVNPIKAARFAVGAGLMKAAASKIRRGGSGSSSASVGSYASSYSGSSVRNAISATGTTARSDRGPVQSEVSGFLEADVQFALSGEDLLASIDRTQTRLDYVRG